MTISPRPGLTARPRGTCPGVPMTAPRGFYTPSARPGSIGVGSARPGDFLPAGAGHPSPPGERGGRALSPFPAGLPSGAVRRSAAIRSQAPAPGESGTPPAGVLLLASPAVAVRAAGAFSAAFRRCVTSGEGMAGRSGVAAHLTHHPSAGRAAIVNQGDRRASHTLRATACRGAVAFFSGRPFAGPDQGPARQPASARPPASPAQGALDVVQGASPLTRSQAKEPVAIQRTRPITWRAPSGGSSRRPAARSAGCRRPAETASEAHEGRSGWKPRALLPFGGASPRAPLSGNVVGRGERLDRRMHLPSAAASAIRRPADGAGSRDRKCPGTAQALSGWRSALDLSGVAS